MEVIKANPSGNAKIQTPDVSKTVKIKLTTGWFTDTPCIKETVVRPSDLSIPGFPTVRNAVMGFHAEFALLGGGYLFECESRIKKDCKIVTLEVGFSSETQQGYADILKTDMEYWKTARVFHLGKAKKVLKKRVADYVSGYLLESGVPAGLVRDAEIQGFDALMNVDLNAVTSIFRSEDFPMLDMVILPVKPLSNYKFDTGVRLPNLGIASPSLLTDVQIDDLFEHKFKL